MSELKEKTDNGLHNKYVLSRTDGTPINPNDKYFVLKIDGDGDINHINACRAALSKYADEIESHIPELAKQIRETYTL